MRLCIGSVRSALPRFRLVAPVLVLAAAAPEAAAGPKAATGPGSSEASPSEAHSSQAAPPDAAPPDAARPDPEPTWHAWFSAGSLIAVPPLCPGVWLGGGVAGAKWGARLEAALVGTAADRGFVAAALTWTGGRARRHLVIDLRLGAGVSWPDPAPLLTAGAASRWGLERRGPLFLGIDGGATLSLGAVPLELELVSVVSVGMHW
jgi:hypothetical protein